MSRFFSSLLIAIAMVCGSGSAAQSQQTHADLIFKNASIYTLDSARSWARALAVANGKIIAVGSNQDMLAVAGPLTRIVDLEGKLVLPGLHDSHCHPLTSEIEDGLVNLNNLETKEQIERTIERYAREHPEKPWITGGGWALPIFSRGGPTRQDLDKIVPDRPVILDSQDGHSAWVNSKALELSGVTRATPDPSTGRIERDPETGEPSGTLREEAIELVDKHAPKLTVAEYREAMLSVQKKFNEKGITSVIDADVNEDMLKALAGLEEKGLLTMRYLASMRAEPKKGLEQLGLLKAWREKYTGELVKATSIKIFTDGVIETRTAALLAPYLKSKDEPETSGTLNWNEEDLNKFATAADASGFQLHFHAIGDRAVRAALNSLVWSADASARQDRRHHIAHLELIDPEDVPRFVELSVTANFQPYWAFKDKYVTEMTEPILGPERSGRLYPIGSVARTGAMLAGGSDWSVSTFNPLEAMEVAVTRRACGKEKDEPLCEKEKISLPQVIAAYTCGGAYLSGNEKITGSVEVGKDADLIVLDRNILLGSANEIHKAKVLVTYFKGREVYRHVLYNPE